MTLMARPTILATAISAICAIFLPTPGTAADAPQTRRIEATLFGGYRTGGKLEEAQTSGATTTVTDAKFQSGSSFGFALNWEDQTSSFYELAYSRQSTTLDASIPLDVSVEYLQIGGYNIFADNTARLVPYVLVTVGVARLVPDDTELQSETKAAAALGAGMKVTLTPHIALRLDGRFYATFFGSDDKVFCAGDKNVACKLTLQGSTLLQPEFSLGFTYGF